MKKVKGLVKLVAVMFALCLVTGIGITAEAADKVRRNIYIDAYQDEQGNWKSNKKIRMGVYSFDSFQVDYGYGDSISGLKVNKRGMKLQITNTYERYDGEERYGYSVISMMPEKTGMYKVSFDVVDSQKKKRGHYTVSVLVSNVNAAIQKVTFGKKTVLANTGAIKKGTYSYSQTSAMKVSGTSDKLKITPNSQYKITGILVVSVGANGKYTYKKVKNGGKITLSQKYASVSQSADGYYHYPGKKYTYVYVSYKDKFLGESLTYSITSKRGRKEIKTVRKRPNAGYTNISYSRIPTASFTLWQY